jgi:hypothetical protein
MINHRNNVEQGIDKVLGGSDETFVRAGHFNAWARLNNPNKTTNYLVLSTKGLGQQFYDWALKAGLVDEGTVVPGKKVMYCTLTRDMTDDELSRLIVAVKEGEQPTLQS